MNLFLPSPRARVIGRSERRCNDWVWFQMLLYASGTFEFDVSLFVSDNGRETSKSKQGHDTPLYIGSR